MVAAVILATDPLTAQPLRKAWPLAGTHFQPVSRDALDVVQAVAVVVALVTASLAAVRASRGSGPPVTAVVPVALAVLMTAGQRLPLPAGVAYPLLSMMAAAFVWFAVSRVGEPPRRAAARGGSSGGRGEGVRDASGKPGDGYWPDDRTGGDYVPEGQYVTYGQKPGPAQPPGDFPGGTAARAVPEGGRGRRPGPPPRPPERPDRYRGPGPRGSRELATDERPGRNRWPRRGLGGSRRVRPAERRRSGSPVAAAARPYGRILIFTLLDNGVAEFDRIAEETAEHVRTGEPDTLVYVIHLVPNAPCSGSSTRSTGTGPRSTATRAAVHAAFRGRAQGCVLATNVIELRLKYAKVAPLPSPRRTPPAQPAASPGRRRAAGTAGAPWAAAFPAVAPARPQRSDQPRYGERYGPPGYEQPRYEQPGYGPPGRPAAR